MALAVPENRAVRRLASLPSAWVSGGFIALLVLLVVLSPFLYRGVDPLAISQQTLAPPSMAAPFGTDELGRDVLHHVILGGRVSLYVGLLAALAATLMGTMIGAVSGFLGGKADTLIMRITEIFQVMPSFVLAALIVALIGPGESRVILVIAALSWPQTARLMRGEVMRTKQYDFVNAARCLGQSEARILFSEVVPNCFAPVLALGTLTIAQAILLEASLSFFGLTAPDTIGWGRILSAGQRFIYQAWWLSVFPGLAILFTVLSFNILGDCVRRALDPKE